MNSILSLALALSLGVVSTNLYAKTHGAMKEPTKEERAKMAEMHEQMAACLKSDKSMEECHKEMKENCPMAKDGSCSMMGDKMHHDH